MGVICLFLLGMSYVIYHQRKEQAKLYQAYTVQKLNNETFHKVLSRNQKAVAFSDYISINPKSNMKDYSNNQNHTFSCNILKGKIVLFVPEKSCNVCYDEVYDALQYAKDSLNIELLIVAGERKYNETRNILKDMGISSDVYSLNDDKFWDSLKIVYAPFLSYVDNDIRCRHCFIPFPNHPDYSFRYLKNIVYRYYVD